MTPIMWWGLIASDFLAKLAKLASRWRHNFSLVPELQMCLYDVEFDISNRGLYSYRPDRGCTADAELDSYLSGSCCIDIRGVGFTVG